VQRHTDERLVLEVIKNHGEFKDRLQILNLTSDFGILDAAVVGVVKSWFALAKQHEEELKSLDLTRQPRAVYSRAYYAAYNASKAVRYLSHGVVSLGGDDHRKVSDLPDSFPDVDAWARDLQVMYQHRLRADYDNWTMTPSEHILTPGDCAALAQRFIAVCERFLKDVYKVQV
jgi:hypothetical protein